MTAISDVLDLLMVRNLMRRLMKSLGTFCTGEPIIKHALILKRQNTAEIRFKLKHNDFADDMIERVIAELYEKKYLDDRRYAEAYIRSYSATKGRKLIETELAYKKIDRELIREAYEEYLEESEYDEDKVIEDMIRKKYGSADLSDIKVKSKIISYFSRKGFNLDKVNNHLT